MFQGENIRRAVQNAFMIEFIYDFIAQAFNIKGFTGDKVNQPFNRLGRAGEPSGAAADGFVFFANRVGAAFRADVGKYKFLRIGGASRSPGDCGLIRTEL